MGLVEMLEQGFGSPWAAPFALNPVHSPWRRTRWTQNLLHNPTGRLLTLTGLGGVEAVRSTLVRCRLQPNSEGLLCSCSKRNQ